jgi:hypothetical protein
MIDSLPTHQEGWQDPLLLDGQGCAGGRLNNTTAVKNEDGTFTFRFKVKCEHGDQNRLEVPAGPFDAAARYCFPEPEIMNGEWTIPRPVLKESAAR